MRRPILLMHNPASRAGTEAADAAAERLSAAGSVIEQLECPGREETIARLRAHHARYAAVAAVGGDGTMNTAANGLAGTDTPLAVIPAGTANDLARTLGLPDDPAEAAALIVGGVTRMIDLGEVNGCYFLNVASIGLSVDLARTLTRDLKRRFGKLSYAIAATRVALGARPFRAAIEAEGDQPRPARSYQIAVGNGRFYGGGMAITEDAAIDDGRLALYSLETRGLLRLALMLPDLRAGKQGGWSEVETAEGRWFEVRTRRPLAVNADGEIVAETPARFRLHRRALRVFTSAA
ncbi:MAG: lipid kinase [Sphingomonadaceae bacterium]|nr:lipid kinase [Sphingomonadaceae bacterium]